MPVTGLDADQLGISSSSWAGRSPADRPCARRQRTAAIDGAGITFAAADSAMNPSMILIRTFALTTILFSMPLHAQGRLVSIDVLLQPDAQMLDEAAAWSCCSQIFK
jgi:hypothetical protein